ncbi:hypothetical protein BO79DRAFT_162406, partial [Aspergillus costaricaensis CBS 115574]
ILLFKFINRPAVFQYFINKIFMDFLDKFIIIYIDNILIFNKNKIEYKFYIY